MTDGPVDEVGRICEKNPQTAQWLLRKIEEVDDLRVRDGKASGRFDLYADAARQAIARFECRAIIASQDRTGRRLMSRSVSLAVLQLRDRAREMYSRAIRLHYSILGVLSDAEQKAKDLEALVIERPSDARLIILALQRSDAESAGEARYENIITVLHSMLAR